MCRSTLSAATTDVVSDNSLLGTVSTSGNSDQWIVNLQLNGKPGQFKIHTGADMTAVSETTFKKLDGVTLRQTNKSLCGLDKHKLQVCGQFTGTLTYKQTEVCQEIFVVQGLQQALMGRPAIEALHLISRVNFVIAQRNL